MRKQEGLVTLPGRGQLACGKREAPGGRIKDLGGSEVSRAVVAACDKYLAVKLRRCGKPLPGRGQCGPDRYGFSRWVVNIGRRQGDGRSGLLLAVVTTHNQDAAVLEDRRRVRLPRGRKRPDGKSERVAGGVIDLKTALRHAAAVSAGDEQGAV